MILFNFPAFNIILIPFTRHLNVYLLFTTPMILFVLKYSHAIIFAERSKGYYIKHLLVDEFQDVTVPTVCSSR